MKNLARWLGTSALALAGFVAVAVPSANAQDDPWARGANWLTVRAGYAKSNADGAGNGGGGYGFGYSRMLQPWKIWRWTLFNRFSAGVHVQHDILGGFGSSQEIEVPLTAELVHHFEWNSAFHPYAGFGTGAVLRKLYRTDADDRSVEVGYYLTVGGNVPVSRMQLLGADVRFMRVDSSNDPPNPVFGTGGGEIVIRSDGTRVVRSKPATHWSAKIAYTIAY